MPSLLRLIGRLFGARPADVAATADGLPDALVRAAAPPTIDTPAFDTPHPDIPRPNPPVCIIGDVHGMADLLETLLAQIAVQPSPAQPGSVQPRLIFVGDLIDRGPQSAAVLARVMGLCLADPAHHICLMGNHERMLLDALADADFPADQIKTPQIKTFNRWLGVGGAETCDSFGVTAYLYHRPKGVTLPRHTQSLHTAAALRAAMGPDLLNWLQSLPLYWQEGDLAVSHAGADPAVAMTDQDPDTLIWGPSPKRRAKASAPQLDQKRWLIHGHVIVPQVDLTGTDSGETRHIGIDTGAYRTGRLTALWLDENGPRVITATAK